MRFSEYLFDAHRRETLTRDHLITAKTIKRAHNRRTDAKEAFAAFLIAALFISVYVGAQRWTKMGVDARFTPEATTSHN